MYNVFYTSSASRDWKKIPSVFVPHLKDAIENLTHNPRPPQSEKLAGTKDAYRLRKEDYRVLYTIDDSAHTVVIYKIAHRRESYR